MLRFFLIAACFSATLCNAQLQISKWYFGGNAGLDFATSPPSVISNTNLSTSGGMSSISDAAGNLLFYTDGSTIWNSQHQVMANGSGLSGSTGALQNVVITPSGTNSNVYYVFTSSPLSRSTVNMSLAAGLGSVVAKNNVIFNAALPNVVSAFGCDVVQAFSRDQYSHWRLSTGQFLTNGSTYSTSATSNTIGGSYLDKWLKVSPDGNAWALIAEKPGSGQGYYTVEIRRAFFFTDPSFWGTPLVLTAGTALGDLFACEFSPDGTKFYVSSPGTKQLYQWDLCAGSQSAVIGSLQSFSTGTTSIYGMQLAPDGKIYCASNPSLSVINNPNLFGAACGFSALQQSIGTASCGLTLPNFCSGFMPNTLGALAFSSQSLNCSSFSFTLISTSSFSSCSASAQQITSVIWNFGEPSSGAANTSTLFSPTHQYAAPGTYTVKMVAARGCRKDTVAQTVLVIGPWPSVSLSGNFSICPNAPAVITASGANSYTWSNTTTGSVLTVSPANSSTYSVVGVNNSNGCSQLSTFSIVVQPQPVILLSGNFTVCAKNSAVVKASGALSYTWSNTSTGSLVTLFPANSGTYSVLGMNQYNCQSSLTFSLTVLPCTGIMQLSPEYSEVLVYPNPNHGVFEIKLKQLTKITITDPAGRPVYTAQLKVGVHEIDLSQFTNGLYFLTAKNKIKSQTIKLVKE